MKNVWREYGVIGTLLVVAVGGYFLIGDRTDDILAYSLDAIGHKLTELVADDAGKEEIADAFDRFKARVDSNEVAPEQIETIAANVLNLSISGASLSTEEAEMVLDLATEPIATALPVPGIADEGLSALPDAETPLPNPEEGFTRSEFDEARLAAVGTRVSSMIRFAEKMQTTAESDEWGSPARTHYRFAFEDGLHVVVDTMVESLLDHEEFRALADELKKESWFSLERNMEEKQLSKYERIKFVQNRIARAREAVSVGVNTGQHEALTAMERFNRLQELGLVVKMDTSALRMRLDLTIQEAMKHLESEIEANDEASRETASGRVRENSN